MKIAILETGVPPKELINLHGTYADMLARLLSASGASFEFQTFAVRNNEFPKVLSLYDGWVVTGSAASAYDNLPWIEPLKELIREIWQLKAPLIGICFGHQIVAAALGGRVARFSEGWGCGVHQYEALEPMVGGTGCSTVTLNAMHQDQVVEKPAAAEVIMRSGFCEYAGLLYGDSMVTLQPHPEFSRAFETEMLCLRDKVTIPAERAREALATLTLPTNAREVGEWLAAFLQRSAEP